MMSRSDREASLYRVLAESAPASCNVGETTTTKATETLDNDIELLGIWELMQSA